MNETYSPRYEQVTESIREILNSRRIHALNVLNLNRGDKPYTPPAKEHYPHLYYWDTGFVAIARARLGDTNGAVSELEQIKLNIHQDGFMPNIVFDRQGRRVDPERRTFTTKEHSDYTQPPIYAEALLETYEAIRSQDQHKAREFLQDHYRLAFLHYDYFIRSRKNPESGVYKIIHPHETGMDSIPNFDAYKWRLSKKDLGPLNRLKGGANYLSTLKLNMELRKHNYDPSLTSDVFENYDPSYNSILAYNLRAMSKISELMNNTTDKERFNLEANLLEESILKKMWCEEDKMFYSLDKNGKFIKEISISNLFPLVNSKISEAQLSSILNLLNDANQFGLNFPVPSVPKSSKMYDPDYKTFEIWRGPTWINTNWYLVERGLLEQFERFGSADADLTHRCLDTARKVVKSSYDLTKKQFSEFYNPENGRPLRVDSVTDFAWSVLALTHADELYEDLAA